MAYRSHARRPRPHDYARSREIPDTCRLCGLPERNDRHDPRVIKEYRRAERAAEDRADFIDPSEARHIRERIEAAPAIAPAARLSTQEEA